jgi:hypothetical protein
MLHAQFCHHCLMAAFQQLHHLSPVQEEARLEDMADVVILDSAVVEEEEDMTREDHLMIGDLAEVSHRANGGEVKHRRSVSLAMEEEEEAAVLEGQMAVGMDEEGEDGDVSQNITTDHHGCYPTTFWVSALHKPKG